MLAPQRIETIVKYILEGFNKHTKRNSLLSLDEQRKKGFNALFAARRIDFAKAYYNEFKSN